MRTGRPHKQIVKMPTVSPLRLRELTHLLIQVTVAKREMLLAMKGQSTDEEVVAWVTRLKKVLPKNLQPMMLPSTGGRPANEHIQFVVGTILDDWFLQTKIIPTVTKRMDPLTRATTYNQCAEFVMETMWDIQNELRNDTTPESRELAREFNPDTLYRCIQNVIKLDKHRWTNPA